MPIERLMKYSDTLANLGISHFIANFTDRGNNIRDLIIKGSNHTYRIDMVDDYIRSIELLDKSYLEMLESPFYDGISRFIYSSDNTLNSLDELFGTF